MRVERVVVTGGRRFTDGARIHADLRSLLPLGLRRVAQGGNGLDEQFGQAEAPDPEAVRSADTLAWWAACSLGLVSATYRVNFTADVMGPHHAPEVARRVAVDGSGRGAPCRRNIRMLEAERPDLVLAYPDPNSRGTWHCAAEARRRGIPVAVWVSWGMGGGAGRVVQRELEARRVSLARGSKTAVQNLALWDRGGHRVVVCDDERFLDALPEEMDG